jgi:hypothetical protein
MGRLDDMRIRCATMADATAIFEIHVDSVTTLGARFQPRCRWHSLLGISKALSTGYCSNIGEIGATDTLPAVVA